MRKYIYMGGKSLILALVAICLIAPLSLASAADTSLTLSVQPPLFQINLGPGEHWASSITVTNPNKVSETLFPSVLNFQIAQPNSETKADQPSQGMLVPVVGESASGNSYNLASWVTVSKAPVTIKAGKSVSVPFSIEVPKTAAPGDHYAALIIGTESANSNVQGANVSVASKVSSLLFVRVRGKIIEQGNIREFRASQGLYQTSDAELIMRVENSGNVRIKPVGKIDIYNMWGKLRGTIPINEESGFGNVLPSSTNQSVFSWGGEHNFFELGRYRAVATLTYGDSAKTMTAVSSFWILPIIATTLVLGTLTLLALFIIWAVRRFVRRSLRLEMEQWRAVKPVRKSVAVTPRSTHLDLPPTIRIAIILSFRQLRDDLRVRKSWSAFWSRNSHSLMVIVAVVLMIAGLGIYWGQTLKLNRSYEIVIHKDDGRDLRINSTQ